MRTLILYPLSKLYSLITDIRNICFDTGIFPTYKSRLPVISVGNLTAGGNGKSPLVMYIAQELLKAGKKPIIISRGYGGTVKGPHLVTESDTPSLVGDEPKMFFERRLCPVIIARSRIAGAKFVEEKNLGDIIILDDGFQHRWLNRDIDLICIDVSAQNAQQRFVEGKLLPHGQFRENKESGLRRATAVMYMSRGGEVSVISELVKCIPRNLRQFKTQMTNITFYNYKGDIQNEDSNLKEAVVLTSIANPDGFIRMLEGQKIALKERHCFPDHYQFMSSDIEHVVKLSLGLPILCTEKDMVKLKGMIAKDVKIFCVRTELVVEPKNIFDDLILSRGKH